MTILIVDDSPVDAKMIQAIISREGVVSDFLFAKSGEEGIALTKKNHIDIIIVDILMPGMHGFEATRKIKEIQPDVKTIIVTNAEEEIHPDRVRDVGVDFYTSKKLIDYTLMKAVRKILDSKKD